jgi:hypothetical protein
MSQHQVVELDTRPALRHTSRGDGRVWLAYGITAQPVLRFTTTNGQPVEIALSHDELATIATTATAIHDADDNQRQRWLAHAAQQAHIRASRKTDTGAGRH